MQLESAVAIQNVLNVGELGEVVFYAFDRHHGLSSLVDGHGLVFYTLGSHKNFWQPFHLVELWSIGSCHLSLNGFNL